MIKNKEVHDRILAEVKRIEFSIRKILSGVSIGVKNSTFRGQGMTFSDIRSYTPGDDIRNFAWQVMARTGEPFVKEFEEERDLEVHVALDMGPSMKFGGKAKSKAMIQAYVLAFLGLSTAKSRDKFGGILFSSQQLRRIPVSRGDDNVRRALFAYLEENEKKDSRLSDVDVALDYFLKLRAKNCICVLISDFAKPLNRKLLARVKSKHEVKIIFINDPYEASFPKCGFMNVSEPGSLAKIFWAKGSDKLSYNFNAKFQKRKNEIERICKSFGIPFVDQSTHDENLREVTKSLKLGSVYG